MGVALHWCN